MRSPVPAELRADGDNFAELSGRRGSKVQQVALSAKALRMGQNRFALWRILRDRWDWGVARTVLELV